MIQTSWTADMGRCSFFMFEWWIPKQPLDFHTLLFFLSMFFRQLRMIFKRKGLKGQQQIDWMTVNVNATSSRFHRKEPMETNGTVMEPIVCRKCAKRLSPQFEFLRVCGDLPYFFLIDLWGGKFPWLIALGWAGPQTGRAILTFNRINKVSPVPMGQYGQWPFQYPKIEVLYHIKHYKAIFEGDGPGHWKISIVFIIFGIPHFQIHRRRSFQLWETIISRS